MSEAKVPQVPLVDGAAAASAAAPAGPSRELLAAAFDQVQACIAILSGPDLRFVLVNPAYQAIAPGTPMLGRPFREVFPEAAAAGAEVELRSVLDTGATWSLKPYHAPVPNQSDAMWEGETVRLHALPGEPPSVMALVHNVTARVKTEAALAESERRLAFLVKHAPAFMAVLRGPRHVIELANERYFEVIGRRDVVGKTVIDAMPELRGQPYIDFLDSVYRNGVPVEKAGSPVRLGPPGAQRELSVDFVYLPLFDPDGAVSGIFVHGVDVSQRAENEQRERGAREAAEHAAKFAEIFVAVLGHDLRNPLSAIQSGAHIIDRTASDERQRRVAVRMLSSSMRMERMIDQILDFSRIRTGSGLHHEPRALNLQDLLSRVVEELTGERAARITMEILGDRDGYGDEDRLEQVFSNLVSNALEHSPAESRVRIALDGREPARVVVRVDNDGVIPAELLPQVFEPFRQARHYSKGRGLGLGLYITKEIAKIHGGTVDVTSSSERGTTFQVVLPRGKELVPAASPPEG